MKQETYRLSYILSSSRRKDIPLPVGVFSKHCLLSFLHLNTLGHILTPDANSNLDVRNSCDDVTSSVSIMLFCDIIFAFNRWKWIGSKGRSNPLALNFYIYNWILSAIQRHNECTHKDMSPSSPERLWECHTSAGIPECIQLLKPARPLS